MTKKTTEQVHQAVLEKYSNIAQSFEDGTSYIKQNSCCNKSFNIADLSLQLGYTKNQTTTVPEGSNLGLGCGNPQAIAAIKKGETVLDLGCGGGFDVFLAAAQLDHTGLVIGVDMSEKMIALARRNAEKGGFKNTDFRLSEIEHLPVADQSVDVIISNCVINLSTQKQQVFHEAFRVLKPGGRLAISDVLALQPLPESIQNDLALHAGCIAGASLITEVEQMLREAGFRQISIEIKEESKQFISDWTSNRQLGEYVASSSIMAVKPSTIIAIESNEDLFEATELLKKLQLPYSDLIDSPVNLYQLKQQNRLIGMAGLELYGGYALLRSLAIIPEMQKQGIGKEITREIEQIAQQHKVKELYLLTTTAALFFGKLGFQSISRSEVPATIQQTSEFASICPDSAICMRKSLR